MLTNKDADLNKKLADLADTFGAFDFDATEGCAGETFKFQKKVANRGDGLSTHGGYISLMMAPHLQYV